jgi:hypothetical protein
MTSKQSIAFVHDPAPDDDPRVEAICAGDSKLPRLMVRRVIGAADALDVGLPVTPKDFTVMLDDAVGAHVCSHWLAPGVDTLHNGNGSVIGLTVTAAATIEWFES